MDCLRLVRAIPLPDYLGCLVRGRIRAMYRGASVPLGFRVGPSLLLRSPSDLESILPSSARAALAERSSMANGRRDAMTISFDRERCHKIRAAIDQGLSPQAASEEHGDTGALQCQPVQPVERAPSFASPLVRRK
jgi:hypothetical protein